jgi:hypothetical protein
MWATTTGLRQRGEPVGAFYHQLVGRVTVPQALELAGNLATPPSGGDDALSAPAGVAAHVSAPTHPDCLAVQTGVRSEGRRDPV